MKKIVIVEDEIKLREELKTFLENNGYVIKIITDFSNATNDILNEKCDLILLDINLPNIDGKYICKSIREKSNTPIIMVTSKNNDIEELLSINYGADDYVTKPYNPQILLARINRLLNRNNTDNIIDYKNVTLNISKSTITIDENDIDLSKNELKIFNYLLNNRGKIISREELIDYLWDNNEFVDDNTLTVNINRLRTTLSNVGLNDVIITKRGQGYIIL